MSNTIMSERKDKIDFFNHYIQNHMSFTETNAQKMDIFEGDLLKYVVSILKSTLSENYFNAIKDRIIPINVLTRVIDKMSKVYVDSPQRSTGNDKGDQWLEQVEADSSIDSFLGLADSYSHLFKGYLLQPYVDDRKIKVRAIPYDRFLPIAGDSTKPEKMDGLITFMGEVDLGNMNKQKLYYYYSDSEFIPFTADGNIYSKALEGNDGVNTYGFIPYVYGNRSMTSVIPKQDTDILQIAKMIPVFLSDLGGAVMFQCFSILYGIDIKADNLTMSPNAFWSLKSDSTSDKTPSVGTIKPEADIDKVKNFIKDVFVLWLETKGVRVGSIGSTEGASNVSGISKIIDEMDVFEIKKNQIQFFKKEERDLWDKMVKLSNIWSKSDEIDYDIIPDDTIVTTEFDEPRPETPRSTEVDTITKEVNGGFLDKFTAIAKLYPDLTDEQIQERMENIKQEKLSNMESFRIESTDASAESDDQDPKGL